MRAPSIDRRRPPAGRRAPTTTTRSRARRLGLGLVARCSGRRRARRPRPGPGRRRPLGRGRRRPTTSSSGRATAGAPGGAAPTCGARPGAAGRRRPRPTGRARRRPAAGAVGAGHDGELVDLAVEALARPAPSAGRPSSARSSASPCSVGDGGTATSVDVVGQVLGVIDHGGHRRLLVGEADQDGLDRAGGERRALLPAGQGPEQVGQAVQVGHDRAARATAGGDGVALGPAHDGAGDVEQRAPRFWPGTTNSVGGSNRSA